ncbi:LysR substrate-binding domain-containing protein [Oceanimonas sp. MB9]|uniref:LysR substrate-binding domain-containing protein n=1 Tax=Oceanimonas sp. MB9 TaxID=2588453 RepID=UPI0013F5B503|nr:LysR substrate-binding domain-containing protein [Oceanimonas sp. MB9]NHI00412.1 HTH-type transcriptional activator CmpR [Oceanimonas sp. MB9]
MKFELLRAYRAVMRYGNVTRAADMIGATQPGVSRMLSQLEHQVGFALFERVKGRLYPTPEGELFFQEVEHTYQGMERLHDTARRIRKKESGMVRVCAMPALTIGFLPRAIARFKKAFPNIHVILTTERSQQVIEQVRAGHCDLAMAMHAEPSDDYSAQPLITPKVCLLPADHPLVNKTVITCEDLRGEPMVTTEQSSRNHQELVEVFHQAGVALNIEHETSMNASCCHYVANRLGVALVDPFSASSHRSLGYEVRPFEPIIPFTCYLLQPRHRPRASTTDDFHRLFMQEADAVLAEFGIGPG